MCGRFEISVDDNFFKRMKRDNESEIKYGEIFPTDIVPAFIDMPETEHVVPMYWGFANSVGRSEIINVRSESVHEKTFFRDSIMKRRCVIKCTGFYEWNKYHNMVERGKYMFKFFDEPMYLACIYKFFKNENIPRFSILTTEANEYMVDIHDRMPIVLKDSELQTWFSDDYEKLFDMSSVEMNRISMDSSSQISLFD